MDDPSKAIGTSFGGGQKVNPLLSVNTFIDLIGFRFLGCCFKPQSTLRYLQAFLATAILFALQVLLLVGVVLTQYIAASSSLVCRLFATWAPDLYSYYVQHIRLLYAKYPHLRRNFLNSIFTCCTFNFGPHACSFDHTDPANLLFGWCDITALGPFDPIRSGHLVLWDLKIVIEFPPGSTIIIPSATL